MTTPRESFATTTPPIAEAVVKERSWLSRFWWLLLLVALAAILALILGLRGCGTDTAGEAASGGNQGAASGSETAPVDVNSLVVEDEQRLIADIKDIAPAAAADETHVVNGARGLCAAILGGAADVNTSVADHFGFLGTLDDETALKLFTYVRDQPWCHP